VQTTQSNPFAALTRRLTADTREIDLTRTTLPGVDRAALAEEFEYLKLYDAVTPRDGSES
jgi:hypothetical protein